jgi:phosphatidylglycerol:prolipoprotein diacylglycerol transferase
MHPELFQIRLHDTRVPLLGHELWLGAWRVTSFGALLVLAVLLGVLVTRRSAARAGLAVDAVDRVLLVVFLAGLLGARLGYALLHPTEVHGVVELLSLRSGGLSGTFALAAGATAAFVAARREACSPATLFDAAAPAAVLGIAFARVGCFLEGCDFGAPLGSSAPRWLARLGTFPSRSPAWIEHVRAGLVAPTSTASLPVHPSELYESALALALFAAALSLRGRTRAAGGVALLVLVGYCCARVLVDLSRPSSSDVWCVRVAALAVLGLTAWLQWPRARARPT